MFQFYSIFSPRGTPERAALLAAQPIAHEWQWDADHKDWSLDVYGLVALVDIFFCADKDCLYLHENGRISAIPFPKNEKFDEFIFQAWKKKDLRIGAKTGFVPPRLAVPEHWFYPNGEIVDLVALDKATFAPVLPSGFLLPIFNTTQSDKGVCAWLPPKMLSFLRSKSEIDAFVLFESLASKKIAEISLKTSMAVFRSKIDMPEDACFGQNATPVFISDGVLKIPANVE